MHERLSGRWDNRQDNCRALKTQWFIFKTFKLYLEKHFANFCKSKNNYPNMLHNNGTNSVKASSFPIPKQPKQ